MEASSSPARHLLAPFSMRAGERPRGAASVTRSAQRARRGAALIERPLSHLLRGPKQRTPLAHAPANSPSWPKPGRRGSARFAIEVPSRRRFSRTNPRLGFQPSRISRPTASGRKKRSCYPCSFRIVRLPAATAQKFSTPRWRAGARWHSRPPKGDCGCGETATAAAGSRVCGFVPLAPTARRREHCGIMAAKSPACSTSEEPGTRLIRCALVSGETQRKDKDQ
jgi:hypothetical protein